MKIVIPTDDRKEIAKRTGRAKYFQIFEIDKSTPTLIKEIRNKHEHHDHHHHEHADKAGHHHGKEVSEIKDAEVMICQHMGKHFKESLDEYSIDVFITKTADIQLAIKEFIAH